MTIRPLCETCLRALNDGDLVTVQALFTPEATVLSPLYGLRPAAAFYACLFAGTGRSDTTLLHRFESPEDPGAIALQFRHLRTLTDGTEAPFECVDVFDLAGDRAHFAKMTIFDDTAPLRADFERTRTTAPA